MKAADFIMTAAVQVADNNAGGAGGVIGGVLGRRAPVVGAFGAGVKFKDGFLKVQTSAAEGWVRKTLVSKK